MSQLTISARPTSLGQVFGCTGLKEYFYKAAKKNDFPKATLLTGFFGSGKTTTAKIIAQMMVCENPKENGDPCCECEACQEIMNETYGQDVIQLTGGIDKADKYTEVFDKFVKTPPFKNKRKVVLVEEVQEFDTDVQKKLLKLLESPLFPTHFILTTMNDSQRKVNNAIISRCVQFKFPAATVGETMYYCKDAMEKVPYTNEDGTVTTLWETNELSQEFKSYGIKAIAYSAQGSFRQALQYLDQCIQSKVTDPAQMASQLGIVSEESFLQILGDLMTGKIAEDSIDILFNKNYESNFNLMYKVIADAECYRVFGNCPGQTEYFLRQARSIADGKNFAFVRDAFYDYANATNGYIKKSSYIIFVSKIMDHCKPQAAPTSEYPSR